MQISLSQTTSCAEAQGHIQGVCVYVCVCMCGFQSKVGGRFWASYAVIFRFQAAAGRQTSKYLYFFLSLPLPLPFFLFHNLSFYRSTRSLETGGPLPKVSSVDTHSHKFGCVCFPFCLYSGPADIGDSWSLAVCKQGRVRMRTACESTH